LVVLLSIASLFILFALNFQNKPFQRLADIYNTLSQSGINSSALIKISDTDGSAGTRIVPTLQLLEHYSYTDLKHILFGNGAGQSTLFYTSLWGQQTTVGFIPSFIYNYGLIGLLVVVICFRPFFPRRLMPFILLFFLFLFNADFNTQIFVFVLFIAMAALRIEKLESHYVEDNMMELRNA
jgi:hypothetical protein